MDNLFLLLVFLAGFCGILAAAALATGALSLFYKARRIRNRKTR